MSWDTERPKGSRWKQYLPKEDWKVVSRLGVELFYPVS